MGIYYILKGEDSTFPHPSLSDAQGIVALGGDLSPNRLLTAYSFGIFPWYSENEPIIWWSPHPRFVLYPNKIKVSKSMRPYFNQQKYIVTIDTAFERVISACQKLNRKGQKGTWITKEMQAAYCQLHELGFAHSVEVWNANELIGGLYGISLGKMFFGESMFSHAPNASKFGFITLTKILESKGFNLIDCQQETSHLKSLGAEAITRKKFLTLVSDNRLESSFIGKWTNWIG